MPITDVRDISCTFNFLQIVCQIPFLEAKCKADQVFSLTLDLSEVMFKSELSRLT